MEKKVIKIDNISKNYLSGERIVSVIQKVNLEIQEGEFVAITGESGCGKTTLLNIISGSLSYDTGEIIYNGKKYSEYTVKEWEYFQKQELGYVAQDNKLINNYTVEQNISCALLLQGYTEERIQQKVNKILSFVDMEAYRSQKICNLSAGQRQRVGIARVLAKDAQIILADEPTANLDSKTGAEIMEIFKRISKDKIVIMVTHNIPQAEQYATRMIHLHDGRVDVNQVIQKNYFVDADKNSNTSDYETEKENSSDSPKNTKNPRQILFQFIRWNITSSVGKSLMTIFLLLLMGGMIFVFGDVFSVNQDVIYTKQFDQSAFKNTSDKRIVIKRKDGKKIDDSDLKRIKKLKYVENVEKYDEINDISYMWKINEDYKYKYYYNERKVQALSQNNFMRSVDQLSSQKLYKGKYPSNQKEVVVSWNDRKLYGKYVPFYFKLPNKTNDQFCAQNCKVVGVCKEKNGQVYFHEQMCDMFQNICTGTSCRLFYSTGVEENKLDSALEVIPIISEERNNSIVTLGTGYLLYIKEAVKPLGNAQIKRYSYKEYGLSTEETKNYNVFIKQKKYADKNVEKIESVEYNELNQLEKDVISYPIDSDFPYMDVSKDLFYKIYNTGSNQMTAYISDYLNTDAVMEQINSLGKYHCNSTYRMSMNKTDAQKSSQRTKILIMTVILEITLMFVIVFFIFFLFSARGKDYNVFQYLGMNILQARRMIFGQLLFYALVSYVVFSLLYVILKIIDPVFLHDYLKFFRIKEYLSCTAIYMIAIWIAGYVFYRKTMKRLNWRRE